LSTSRALSVPQKERESDTVAQKERESDTVTHGTGGVTQWHRRKGRVTQ